MLRRMNDERKAPEYPPENTGTRWLPLADVEGLIGKKERNARYWLERHEIPSRGERPKRFSEQAIIVKLAELGQAFRKAPEMPPEYPPENTGTPFEPIEAAYRATPAAIEQAVSRTSAQYMGDLRTMLAEVGKVYEGQLAAKDETIAAKDAALAAKDQALAAHALTIAELRRRAEVAEAEVARWRQEQDAAQAVPEGPGAQEAPAESRQDTPGVWARVRRWWGGGDR